MGRHARRRQLGMWGGSFVLQVVLVVWITSHQPR